jgi:NIMA (never in mitosis gene a)-related kinase
MEYCEGGDMGSLLKRCKKENDFIAEDVIWKIFTQIALALNECHHRKSGKILHRDLKPANIFLDAQNNIKLGDFGLSRIMSENSIFAYTHVGTPYYMSPEQINEAKYNEKSDIWSAGCLLYEIAALKPPFEATNHLALAMKIKSGKFERLPIRYSEDLQGLVESMLNIDQEKRPSIDDILNIPQIALRLKERKLRDLHASIKNREEECKKKEENLKAMESGLLVKEEEMKKLEFKCAELEKHIKRMESEALLNENTTPNHKKKNEIQFISDENLELSSPIMRTEMRSGQRTSLKEKSSAGRLNTNNTIQTYSELMMDEAPRKSGLIVHLSRNSSKNSTNYSSNGGEFFSTSSKKLLEDITNITNNT